MGGDGVGLRDHDLHGACMRATILLDLGAEGRRHACDLAGGCQQAGIGFVAWTLRIPVANHEVDGGAGNR